MPFALRGLAPAPRVPGEGRAHPRGVSAPPAPSLCTCSGKWQAGGRDQGDPSVTGSLAPETRLGRSRCPRASQLLIHACVCVKEAAPPREDSCTPEIRILSGPPRIPLCRFWFYRCVVRRSEQAGPQKGARWTRRSECPGRTLGIF